MHNIAAIDVSSLHPAQSVAKMIAPDTAVSEVSEPWCSAVLTSDCVLISDGALATECGFVIGLACETGERNECIARIPTIIALAKAMRPATIHTLPNLLV